MLKEILVYLMSTLYLFAGYMHFRKPWLYYKITPPLLLPWKKPINIISGAAEIAGAIGLLIPATQAYAAWGIILLLIAVFPANIYMLTSGGAGLKIKMWILWLRIPLQFVLIAWAYWYT